MIRFSASLVVIAMGLLVAGGVTSKLLLVYVAIALSAVALIFLVIGAILNRGEFRAQPSGDPVQHRDAEPEPAALVGAAPAVNPATSPASLAGQARAAAGRGHGHGHGYGAGRGRRKTALARFTSARRPAPPRRSR